MRPSKFHSWCRIFVHCQHTWHVQPAAGWLAGWVQLDDEFVYFPAPTWSYPAGPDIPPDINNYPPRSPLTPIVLNLTKISQDLTCATLLEIIRNSPDNSFSGLYTAVISSEIKEKLLALAMTGLWFTSSTVLLHCTATQPGEALLQSVTYLAVMKNLYRAMKYF